LGTLVPGINLRVKSILPTRVEIVRLYLKSIPSYIFFKMGAGCGDRLSFPWVPVNHLLPEE
jgi:hypothetical protein